MHDGQLPTWRCNLAIFPVTLVMIATVYLNWDNIRPLFYAIFAENVVTLAGIADIVGTHQ